jgi:meiosis-specific APC/C activator protein AMA1
MQGVHLLNNAAVDGPWITSIDFSSTQGCKSIIAWGRSDGTLSLMSMYDVNFPRFKLHQQHPIACLSWRPTSTMQLSKNPMNPSKIVPTENLLVGDELGHISYYSVEWPSTWEVGHDNWCGSMTLLFRISVHTQQICGLSWSPDGSNFATGGNDNLCLLFDVSRILHPRPDQPDEGYEEYIGRIGERHVTALAGRSRHRKILSGAEKHRWVHGAAVKAIAFCPWREGLVATGGGSNDKCIHFFHTNSGACLATISVAAQVTSLIWSTTRREIAATFGYAQPEHPYRIAIFSWPECKQVAAIPWEGEHRALYAIPYPRGPNERGDAREGNGESGRTQAEGCIVVAASDESVKFHEVWGRECKDTRGLDGLLGGSDILEGLEGVDKEGEIIR